MISNSLSPTKLGDQVHGDGTDQSLLEKAKLRFASWVERVNDEITRESIMLDLDGLKLPSFGSVFQQRDEFSLDLYGMDRKYDDDDSRSTGTADTDDDFQESSDFSSSVTCSSEDEKSSSSYMRSQRLRSRFLPLLKPNVEESRLCTAIHEGKKWKIHIHREEATLRFYLKQEGQSATLVLIGDEVYQTVQGLIDSTGDDISHAFEIIYEEKTHESMRDDSENVLATLRGILDRHEREQEVKFRGIETKNQLLNVSAELLPLNA